MTTHEVTLSATDSNWRLFMVRKADPAFLAFQQKVHARDHHTCQYCSFQAREKLEVVNLDGNYRNNRLDNLTTACDFCTQCFFIEAIGKGEFGGGSLIYLPEMSQAALNGLCHVLFATMVLGSSNAIQARNIYRSFKLRSQIVEKQLGEGLSNPAIFGQLLVDAELTSIDSLNEGLSPKLRLLPDVTRFAKQVAAWIEMGLDELQFEQ